MSDTISEYAEPTKTGVYDVTIGGSNRRERMYLPTPEDILREAAAIRKRESSTAAKVRMRRSSKCEGVDGPGIREVKLDPESARAIGSQFNAETADDAGFH